MPCQLLDPARHFATPDVVLDLLREVFCGGEENQLRLTRLLLRESELVSHLAEGQLTFPLRFDEGDRLPVRSDYARIEFPARLLGLCSSRGPDDGPESN